MTTGEHPFYFDADYSKWYDVELGEFYEPGPMPPGIQGRVTEFITHVSFELEADAILYRLSQK